MSSILFKSKDENYNIEYTIHNCPKSMKIDIYPVFKNELNIDDDILIIPTWQEARLSITNLSEDVSKELDRLFLNFRDWALILKKYVNDKNKWLDASCPFTGKALFGTPTAFMYNELNGLSKLLKYDYDKIGCCGMVYHPQFKNRSYPITFFTNMKQNEFIKLISTKMSAHIMNHKRY